MLSTLQSPSHFKQGMKSRWCSIRRAGSEVLPGGQIWCQILLINCVLCVFGQADFICLCNSTYFICLLSRLNEMIQIKYLGQSLSQWNSVTISSHPFHSSSSLEGDFRFQNSVNAAEWQAIWKSTHVTYRIPICVALHKGLLCIIAILWEEKKITRPI